jgi:hypothetical protein
MRSSMGCWREEAVIQGEDPAEFEGYRDRMLEELAPVGWIETMLADRAAGLAWRLRRAERLQNAAFVALDDCEPTPLLEARHEQWKQLKAASGIGRWGPVRRGRRGWARWSWRTSAGRGCWTGC